MSLFQCEVCGCVENTACAAQGFKIMKHLFDWSYAPEREGKKICSACGPTHYSDSKPTEFGKWHNCFTRHILPLGEFFTNHEGNLEHTETHLTSGEFIKKFPERCRAEKADRPPSRLKE